MYDGVSVVCECVRACVCNVPVVGSPAAIKFLWSSVIVVVPISILIVQQMWCYLCIYLFVLFGVCVGAIWLCFTVNYCIVVYVYVLLCCYNSKDSQTSWRKWCRQNFGDHYDKQPNLSYSNLRGVLMCVMCARRCAWVCGYARVGVWTCARGCVYTRVRVCIRVWVWVCVYGYITWICVWVCTCSNLCV